MSKGMHSTHTTGQHAPGGTGLVRLIVALGSPAAGKPPADFAARLARLFDLSDTIVLDDITRRAPAGPGAGDDLHRRQAAAPLQADLAATRDALAAGIAEAFESGSVSEPLPPPKAARKPGIPPAFEPYQRFHVARQRALASGVQRLRVRARKVLAEGDPALARLAAFDEMFDATAADYSRRGFAALSTVLEKRFRTLWREHRKRIGDDTPDPPEEGLRGGAWLARFHQEMRLLLLMELDARLEPVNGLLAALYNEDQQPR